MSVVPTSYGEDESNSNSIDNPSAGYRPSSSGGGNSYGIQLNLNQIHSSQYNPSSYSSTGAVGAGVGGSTVGTRAGSSVDAGAPYTTAGDKDGLGYKERRVSIDMGRNSSFTPPPSKLKSHPSSSSITGTSSNPFQAAVSAASAALSPQLNSLKNVSDTVGQNLTNMGEKITTALHDAKRKTYMVHSQRRFEDVEKVREKIEREFGCVLDPGNKFLKYWDLGILILLYTQLFYVPFTIGVSGGFLLVSSKPGESYLGLGIAVSLIFMTDTILNFFRAYYDSKNRLICMHSIIVKNYFYGWFIIDLLACTPTSILQHLILPDYDGTDPPDLISNNGTSGGDDGSSGGDNQYDIRYTIVRYLDMLVLLRFARVSRTTSNSWGFSQLSVHLSYVGQEALKYIFLLLWSVHLTACLWSLMYIKDPNDYTWLHKWVESQTYTSLHPFGYSASSILDRYMISLYWATYTFVSLGYGDITPTTRAEIWVCIFVIFVDSVMWAFIIASSVNLVTIYLRESNMFLQTIDAANEILRVIDDASEGQNLDPTLGSEIRSYIRERHKKTKALRAIQNSKQTVETSISPQLWRRLMIQLSQAIFNAVPMLKFLSEASKFRIVCSVVNQSFAAGEYFTIHGSGNGNDEGESYPTRGIYILQTGICVGAKPSYKFESFVDMIDTLNNTVLAPTHKLVPKSQSGGMSRIDYLRSIRSSFAVYNAGKSLGSTDIFLEDDSPALRPITLGALTFVDFAVIPREAIMREIENDPKLKHIYHQRRRSNVLKWLASGISKHRLIGVNDPPPEPSPRADPIAFEGTIPHIGVAAASSASITPIVEEGEAFNDRIY